MNFPLSCIPKLINLYQILRLLKRIWKKLESLDPNKAHGHDMISIRMLKICGKSVIKPLLIIYNKCPEKGCFPNEWKKANFVLVHKKNDKQLLKNYRPISLLPICGKVSEMVLYNSMSEFFIQNNLITPNQSGFKTGDCASTNLVPSLTKYANHLMMATKYRVYILIYRNHLTKYGTKVFTTDQDKTVYPVNF